MFDMDKVLSYLDSFFYTTSRPQMANLILSSINIKNLKNADAETKLMSIGALLSSGKVDDCIKITEHLDFKEIEHEDRRFMVLMLFSSVFEHCVDNPSLAAAMKHIMSAILPEDLLAHQNQKISVSGSLVQLDYVKKLNQMIKGTIFFREFLFNPGSRKCEAGYRLQNALKSQGWDISLLHLEDVDKYSSAIKSDFAMIDTSALADLSLDDAMETLSRLKRYFRKIIMVDVDIWAGTYNDKLRLLTDLVDYFWGFSTDWILADEPAFKGRIIQFPCLGGLDHLHQIIDENLDWDKCSFNFTGSVQGYSPNRMYWLLEFIGCNIPVDLCITSPSTDDGLEPLDSQRIYAEILAATHSAINLTTRRDGSRPPNGRAYEVISLKRLLVQEACPVFNSYFVKGEHFFEFSSIDELAAIVDFLKVHPKTAKTITANAYNFYKQNYSCRKLAEHFQVFL